MLDVDQRVQKDRPSSLAEWVYQAIGQPGVSLRVRLRGNNLHVLCESRQGLEAKTVLENFSKALNGQEGGDTLPIDPENPIYQIIVYGRTLGQERPDWIKQIRLQPPLTQDAKEAPTSAGMASDAAATDPAFMISHESLARSGSPEAIARYLSETISSLGVNVKVLIQNLREGEQEQNLTPSASNRRLWVVCHSNYSPDFSLLAEPLVQQLRSLQLKGFRDAAICSQVSGETSPEWMLRVDLTPPEQMLREWACWGDVQAIARRVNQSLAKLGMEVRAVLKDVTLHLFCSVLSVKQAPAPDKQRAVKVIMPLLKAIAPQGIHAATIYGVESHQRSLVPEQETPTWIEWLSLPAADNPVRRDSPYSLAQQGNLEALTFLLQRLINPDLDRRLATGGIHLKIRRKDDLLHIMSEAPICPPQAQVASPIARFLRQLAIPKIAGVRVYGRRAGSSSPSWNYGVDFVHRRRLVPEATPEFAASDIYVNELVAPTGQPVLRRDLNKEDLKNDLDRRIQATIGTIQRWLCYSQLFVLSEENQALATIPRTPRRKGFSVSQGAKVAIVWGIVGLLLTLQTDWLLGRTVRSALTADSILREHSSASLPQAELQKPGMIQEPPKPMSLPQVSLKKGSAKGTEDFKTSGFTKPSEKSIIIKETENSASQERSRGASAAILAAARSPNPSFNNKLLDEKLALYQQRLLQSGPPDVLVLGSSRALRGIDPIALQDALATQGYPNVEVFNFGINGATAQVVNLIVRRILKPEQLPKLIIWADGARAFNSGREDATYKAIATSEGYQQLQTGSFPNSVTAKQREHRSGETAPSNSITQPLAALNTSYQSLSDWLNQSLAKVSSTYPQRDQLKSLLREQFVTLVKRTNVSPQTSTDPQDLLPTGESIDFDGFLPLAVRFNPASYYKQHPRVAGDYDGDYENFQLGGEQDTALASLLQFAQAQKIDLVFVNLPLTKDYLDPVRTEHEEKFQRYMHSSALERGLIFRDLTQLLLTKPDYFSDPSHLNRYGAYKVSNHIAQDPMIPWPTKK